jgi:hypothetical protein
MSNYISESEYAQLPANEQAGYREQPQYIPNGLTMWHNLGRQLYDYYCAKMPHIKTRLVYIPINPTPDREPEEKESSIEMMPLESLAETIKKSGNQIIFGIQKDHIDKILDYSERYGGFHYHVFTDVAKEISWEPLTLACYFFDWQHTQTLNAVRGIIEAEISLQQKEIKDWNVSPSKAKYCINSINRILNQLNKL